MRGFGSDSFKIILANMITRILKIRKNKGQFHLIEETNNLFSRIHKRILVERCILQMLAMISRSKSGKKILSKQHEPTTKI
ncbi:hypothetical protein BpHYR1_036456 [Brachionus plicatilis]|uniref:Uncharacterized protein n=1 Tax=Brachionus plicatilis TaxID=10195 RepID=A0A3M7P622_BRAPC|nr:hypothetical protein BpHYR1_036456 [Brachionus plicatilis]